MQIIHVLFSLFKGTIPGTAILLISCLLCLATNQTEPIRPPPALAHGNHDSGEIQISTLPASLSVGWRYNTGAPVVCAPVAYGEMIYAVSDRSELIALGTNGTKHWITALPQQPQPERFSTAPLRVDQVILAGTDKGYIQAFSADSGTFRWKVKIGEDVYGALQGLAPEGTNGFSVLALSRNNGSLFRLDLATGRILWASKPCGRSDCSPAAGAGFAVFGACDSALHLIATTTGQDIATLPFPAHGPMAGGAAVANTLVYIGTRNGSILCANATTHSAVWTNQVANGEVFTTPALSTNLVIAGSNDGFLYCLNRTTGQIVWKTQIHGSPTSPAISGDKIVVSSDGTLSLIQLNDGKLLWSHTPSDSLTAPAVVDGKVIVGTDDGFIILYQ